MRVYVRSPITSTIFFFIYLFVFFFNWLPDTQLLCELVNYRLGHADFRRILCIQLFIIVMGNCSSTWYIVDIIIYLSIEETLFYKNENYIIYYCNLSYIKENLVTPNAAHRPCDAIWKCAGVPTYIICVMITVQKFRLLHRNGLDAIILYTISNMVSVTYLRIYFSTVFLCLGTYLLARSWGRPETVFNRFVSQSVLPNTF